MMKKQMLVFYILVLCSWACFGSEVPEYTKMDENLYNFYSLSFTRLIIITISWVRCLMRLHVLVFICIQSDFHMMIGTAYKIAVCQKASS